MSSSVLSAPDFFSNSNVIQSGQEGQVNVDNVRSNDYDLAIVSRDAFDFTTGNKSVRFVFKADPTIAAARAGVFGKGSQGRFAAVVDDGTVVTWKGDTFDSDCQGQPDCSTVDADSCRSYHSVGVSSTHTVVKSGTCVGTSGDNTYGQLDITSPETVKTVACGAGYTVVLRADGIVESFGDLGTLTIPSSWTTFSEQTMPIHVESGENYIAVLLKNGTVETAGIDVSALDDKAIVSISAGSTDLLALDLAGNVYTVNMAGSTLASIPNKCLKVSVAAGRAVALTEEGSVIEWGSGITGIQTVTGIAAGAIVVDIIAGESFSVSVLKDRTMYVSGTAPAYLSGITTAKSGGKESAQDTSDDYDMFPMLRNINGINIMAGVQNDVLGPEYHQFLAADASTKPIIVGKDGSDSVFSGIRGAFKGAILAKADNGADMCFDIKGTSFDPFTASGHQPIANGFITSDASETYEMIITFSPFGKALRFRKTNGAFAQDMPFKYLSVEETGFSSGRVALYVRNAKNFSLLYAEVTDELDASLLPADIIYRDIDNAVLHTKAAEMVVDIADSVEIIGDSVKQTSEAVRELNADYKNKMQDIYTKLASLGA